MLQATLKKHATKANTYKLTIKLNGDTLTNKIVSSKEEAQAIYDQHCKTLATLIKAIKQGA